MDSQSLDGCIQSTLSVLYPPFEVTAATVLCQVLDVVEKTYHGDGLQYLIDFLIPAKHILQCVQQEACAPHCSLVFRHVGWPLCVHEKIVVQLASLDWRSLRPGDFYLQVVPYFKKSPRIVVKCLTGDQHHVEELVVPEVSYTSIFTLEWLNCINRQRVGAALEICLLSTDDTIFRLPWEKVINPEFINSPRTMEINSAPMAQGPSTLDVSGEQPRGSSEGQGCSSSRPELPVVRFFGPGTTEPLGRTSSSREGMGAELSKDYESDQEGEYVDLTRVSLPAFGPQVEPLTQSVAFNYYTKPRASPKCSPVVRQSSNISLRDAGGFVSEVQGHPEPGQNPEAQTNDSRDCLEKDNGGEGEQMLWKNLCKPKEQTFASVLPAVGSRESDTKEPFHTEVQGHPEHELDWRFAMCRFDDGEDTESESAKMGASGVTETAGFRSTAEPEHGCRNPELYHSEAAQSIGGSSNCLLQVDQEGLKGASKDWEVESCTQPLATCYLCKENSGDSSPWWQEGPFSQPSGKTWPSESFSEDRVACSWLSQSLPDGMRAPSARPSEWLSKVDQRQAGQGSSQGLVKTKLPLSGEQDCLEDASAPPGWMDGYQLRGDDGQSVGDCGLQQPEPVWDIPMTEKQESGHPQGEAVALVSSREGAEVRDDGMFQEQQLYLPGVPEALLLEVPRDESWTGPGDHPHSPKEAVATLRALAEHRIDELEKAPMAGRSSSGPLAGVPKRVPKITETSLKWAEDANKGADVESADPYDSWEEDVAPQAHRALPSSPSEEDLQTAPMPLKSVNWELLRSGVACLPGTRDKYGRAVIIITTRNRIWLNLHCNVTKLMHLLLYLRSILRPECQTLGLTVLIDARQRGPVPVLFQALASMQEATVDWELLLSFSLLQLQMFLAYVNMLHAQLPLKQVCPCQLGYHVLAKLPSGDRSMAQDTIPHCIHGALLLVDKDPPFQIEKLASIQCELLTSLKSLYKHIESTQLPREFDGGLPYSHQEWLHFRMRLEHLVQRCQGAGTFLKGAIRVAESSGWPESAKEANALLKHYRQLMKTVLEDARLVKLQSEGGVLLARLRRESSCVTPTEEYRDALEAAGNHYNQVDEGIHQLVKISNQWIQSLELVIDFEALEEGFQEVSRWIENVGQTRLKELNNLDGFLEVLLKAQRQFQDFELVAGEYCQRGWEALRRMETWADLSPSELQAACRLKLHSHRARLQEFCSQLDTSRSRLDQALKLYKFVDQALEWAQKGMHHLASISLEDCNSVTCYSTAITCLEKFQGRHPELSNTRFAEMKELACRLESSLAFKQWHFAWSKCQETELDFERKLEAALRTKRSLDPDWMPQQGTEMDLHAREGRIHLGVESACPRRPSHHSGWMEDTMVGSSDYAGEQELLQATPSIGKAPLGVPGCAQGRKTSLQGSLSHPSPSAPELFVPKRTLRKAQSFDLTCTEIRRSSCQRTLSEPARHGNTGVFIKGLEVGSTELADRTCMSQGPQSPSGWAAGSRQEEMPSSGPSPEPRSWSRKLQHIMEEMVVTEQEYVRSLRYVMDNYFPEMERIDLPQDLRGKRSVIFGNLEKLWDFHSQYFLRELEHCCPHPLRVSHCFLRHKDQFGLYALYSKNKPRSDSLLSSHGNAFFRLKQMQLRDKMDLASYLLKPIQRMSKYALLLKDLIKQCGPAQEQELVYLRAAEEMVRFQLRHGNDLLAMDAIRGCDVNLKEQGQLVRQDEFTVLLGRRKCQRHVFLFEDLILFSKPKRVEGGLDVYVYKHSFKTADIGLTENSGESGLRFEIWFRRRKSSDTYVLQAGSTESKQAWTSDITKILWEQASRNKEIRMQEMVSMGVGSKPFLDIQPSEAAIHDRAIDYIMKGRGARTRASIAVSVFDHANPYKRAHGSAPAGHLSSCSVLGPLNLHTYLSQALFPSTLATSRPFDAATCIEEDEAENETGSQPSLATESSESSSQGPSGSGSNSSDSGCVSSVPQETLCEDLGLPHTGPAEVSLASCPGEKTSFPRSQYVSAV